jgi:hypothetical protein
MKKLVLLAVSLFLIGPLYSQNDSVYFLPKLKIYQKIKGEVNSFSFEEFNYNKFIVAGNVLIADTNRYKYSVKVNDIDHISFQDGRNFWGGAMVMGIVGYTLGFLFYGLGGPYGFSEGEPSFKLDYAILGGFIGAVPFGLLGGLIGLLAPAYDEYELKKIPADSKTNYLKKVFKKKGSRF